MESPLPDVLMAPHHGSRTANTAGLAEWARAKVVVSCQGPPRGRPGEPYSDRGALFLGTWPHGAITVRSTPQEMTVDTFVTGEWIRVR
jgi:beta-lactamase superfamily II metal-dependent hydrolase